MCQITVYKGEEKIGEEIIEFRYDNGVLILKKLFKEEIELKGVKRFEWREKDDILKILD
jgi:hypothetical protein